MDSNRIRALLDQRDELDRELLTLVGGNTTSPSPRKPVACSVCNGEGHTARTCPTKSTLRIVEPNPNGNDAV